MKKIINFLFYCVVNTVSEKAIFGRWQVACTLFSSISFFLFCSIYMITVSTIKNMIKIYPFTICFIICYIYLFYITRKVYLNEKCKNYLIDKYSHYSKSLLKVIGCIYLIMCYIVFIITAVVTQSKQNTSDFVALSASATLVTLGLIISAPVSTGLIVLAGVGYGVYRIAYGDEADVWINNNFGIRK